MVNIQEQVVLAMRPTRTLREDAGARTLQQHLGLCTATLLQIICHHQAPDRDAQGRNSLKALRTYLLHDTSHQAVDAHFMVLHWAKVKPNA